MVIEVDSSMDELEALLTSKRYRFNDETALQDGIGKVFTKAKIAFEAEVRLSPADRIDFLVGNVGLEVKVKGTEEAAHMQLLRYAEHDRILGLLLVSGTKRIGDIPPMMRGKPVRVVYVERVIF